MADPEEPSTAAPPLSDAEQIASLRREVEELRARELQLQTRIAKLQEDEDRFRALVTAAFEGITVSVDGKVVEANEAAARLARTTREKMIGMTVSELTTPEDAVRVMERIRSGIEGPYEILARRTDGTFFPCEIIGRNTVYLGKPARITAYRDLTARKEEERERRRLEEQVLHVQRLEQLGVLAGGIAHDFNNLALVILGHTEIGLSESRDPSVRRHLEQIRIATSRAGELTKQMLTYSGRAPTSMEAVDLPDLVREMTELLRASISKKATLRLDVGSGSLGVLGDPAQLRQIVLNLITNASDAVERTGGLIHVAVGPFSATTEYLQSARLDATEGPGQYASLEVSDTGIGMNADTLDRIFDPFFSTKFSGRGLGLAAVLGIVRAHSGAISVESRPDGGTRFRVLIPECREPLPPRRAAHPAPAGAAARCVLVVDDQPMIRRLISEFLESAGFTVRTATDGRAAVDLLKQEPSGIDLVVLDMLMPEMGGAEALPELRALRPGLPVLLLSGFYDAALPSETREEGVAFLPKPFRTSELLRTVNDLLGISG